MKKKDRFVFFYFLFLFTFPLKAQVDTLEDFTIQFGLDSKSTNTEKFTFEEFRSYFKDVMDLNQEFSTYHLDTTFEHFGIAPVSLRLDYGFKSKLGKLRLFKYTVYRIMVEFNRSEMYYTNFLKEESDGEYMILDTVHRDYYSYTWNQNSFSVIFGLQINSRPLFKRKRDRFWFGCYVSNGIGTGAIHKFHSFGDYPGKYTGVLNGIDQYQYEGPSYNSFQIEDDYDLGKIYLFSFQIPAGYERLCGKFRNFGLGFQFLFGRGFLTWKGNTVPTTTFGVMYNFRFLFNN